MTHVENYAEQFNKSALIEIANGADKFANMLLYDGDLDHSATFAALAKACRDVIALMPRA